MGKSYCEYGSWTWLYSVYGVEMVDDAIALYDGGWRAEDKENMMAEYDIDSDTADAYIMVFDRLAEGEENEE